MKNFAQQSLDQGYQKRQREIETEKVYKSQINQI